MSKSKDVLRFIAKMLSPLKPVAEAAFGAEAAISRAWASGAHHRLHLATWGLPPNPEYYDHNLDLYWVWPKTRNSLWLERGVYSCLAIKPNSKMLELCCGDGFNAYYFYSLLAGQVTAVDFDPKPIRYAQRHYRLPTLEYAVADIRTEMPRGDFENIVWDAAIEHFTEAEIATVMRGIKERLAKNNGILSGYTLVERADGHKHLHQHEREFRSKEDLLQFFTPHFKNVTVFETKFPTRHNLYFWASDGAIPFSLNWIGAVSVIASDAA